jgi:hypothetical protein
MLTLSWSPDRSMGGDEVDAKSQTVRSSEPGVAPPGREVALWLVRTPGAGDARAQAAWREAFAPALPATVLAAPGGPDRALAAALARSCGAELVADAGLAPAAPGEDDAALARRAWPALARALDRGASPLLAVLAEDVLRSLACLLLEVPSAHARALEIDPGRALLVLSGPLGWTLRRANVAAAELASSARDGGG